MSIIGSAFPDDVATAIEEAVAGLPEPLIVRSSSLLEGSGTWSGAFTSVPEVLRDEVLKATRSVWATCFSLEVLERYEAAGIEPESGLMGVMVQPEILPDFGGAARVDDNGEVTIDAVKGSPRDLMAGWSPGNRAVVSAGRIAGDDAIQLMGEVLLQGVAGLASRVRDELGHNFIEWAVVGDEPWLLQVQTSVVNEVEGGIVIPAALGHEYCLEFVRLAHEYPGALGEELVLSWLPGMRRPVEPILPAPEADSDELLAQARALARQLTADAWSLPPEEAANQAALVLRRMRSDRPNESIEVLQDLAPVDDEAAGRVLGIARRLIGEAASTGRRGLDRWEPVLAGVIALQGEVFTGTPSVGGIGAGRLVWVENSKQTEHVRPRDIIVTQYPLPNFSPLLWDAAGIIALGGAPTAHLFEVARSLTVPAVIECPIGDVVGDGPVLGMLDGDAGRVALIRD
jgi:phosphohistidine swiveling domain-containing protein